MNFNNIPHKMRVYRNWIVWRLEDKGRKKPTKVPYCVYGGPAKVNDPRTWSTFDEAVCACQEGDYNGVGFVFTNTPFIGVDIDGCLDKCSKELSQEAIEVLEIAKSYTELSQSGSGLHIILEGSLPQGRRRNGNFEMYGEGSNRYFAITGELYDEYIEIRNDQQAINTIHQQYIALPCTLSMETKPLSKSVTNLTDDQIIERACSAKNGGRFSSLWAGNISEYDNDHSRADLALCRIMAFWCQRDFQQIDRLFRQSGLMRPKWDELHGKETYGNMTIQEAVKHCETVYTGGIQNMNTEKVNPNEKEWEQPIPFNHINIPDFPVHRLPKQLSDFVEALSESTQTPNEMAGVLSLGILSTAFQSRYIVERNSDWKEQLCLYTIAVAPPADRKSAVIRALTKPVYAYEAYRKEKERKEVAKNQAERANLEAELNNVRHRIGKKGENDMECRKRVEELTDQLEFFQDRYPYQLFADDITQEKLIVTMEEQKGCLTVASSEGGVFGMMAGRYDKSLSFDVYLKAHSGDPITVERMGRKKNSIPQPRLSMILTVQPEVLTGVMDNKAFKERGLCARFLYAVCRSKIGHRNVEPKTIPQEIKKAYEDFIFKIFSSMDSGVIHLSEGANQVLNSYIEITEQRLVNEWDCMMDWGGKLAGAALRISALIHATENPDNASEQPISSETMNSAIEISECLSAHAMKAYQIMSVDDNQKNAKYLWEKIQKINKDIFRQNELFDLCKGKLKKVEDMKPALNLLSEMHYIKISEVKTGEKGRPGTNIIVNPLTKNSKNSKNE